MSITFEDDVPMPPRESPRADVLDLTGMEVGKSFKLPLPGDDPGFGKKAATSTRVYSRVSSHVRNAVKKGRLPEEFKLEARIARDGDAAFVRFWRIS